MSKAVRKYEEFHQHEPKKIGSFAPGLVIPSTAICVGKAVNVLYRSDKLNPTTGEDEGWIDYIHDHSAGVNVYRCDKGAQGRDCKVPSWLQRTTELVWLGHCLGFEYTAPEIGRVDANATYPLPELYTTPSGRALFVIQGKRTLLAMMWGGKLGVEQRGIVH